jgi:dienelactone hydrolase
MSRTYLTLAALIILLNPTSAYAEMYSETVTYELDGVVMEGYLVYDASLEGVRPGVLVVHEWMGINDYARNRATQLAELGYIAFAADIYGVDVRPTTMEEAAQASGAMLADRQLLRGRVNAALDVLRSNELTDPDRIAAIGYCFGGAVVLELARSGADVRGVVTFHGDLATPTPEDMANFQGSILACHGADDPYVTSDDVLAFIDECRNAGIDYEVNIYGNAVHGFTNPANGSDPSVGVAYNPIADHRSWLAMRNFFDEIFFMD